MRNLLLLAAALGLTAAASAQNGEATITQAGNNNDASISQSGGAGNVASITQNGPNGDSNVQQVGGANEASATISGGSTTLQIQTGLRNQASIGDRFDQLSSVTQIQTGNDNEASVTSQGNTKIRKSELTQTQEGDENVSVVTDFRNQRDASSFTDQFGFQNEATVAFQSGAEDNVFEITQEGSALGLGENTATVTFGNADDNQVVIGQFGELNTATVTQMSDANTATLSQTGVNNAATVTQQ